MDPQGDLPPPDHHPDQRSGGDQAAAYIRRLIFDGVLTPGTRVPQEQVAQVLGISRIPVREAIVALAKEGRVRIERHRGAFVTLTTEREAADMGELTSLAHGLAGRRSAERRTPEFEAELCQRCVTVEASGDPIELYHAFEALLELVVEFGLGQRIARILHDIRAMGPDTLYERMPALVPAIKLSCRRITIAITTGDGDEAEAMFAACFADISRQVIETFRTQLFRPESR